MMKAFIEATILAMLTFGVLTSLSDIRQIREHLTVTDQRLDAEDHSWDLQTTINDALIKRLPDDDRIMPNRAGRDI